MKVIGFILGFLDWLFPPATAYAGYLDPDSDQEVFDGVIGTWPTAAAPANGVSGAAALKWINDALQGANGVVTFPAAAAPANAVNFAEVLAALYEHLRPKTLTGTTDIDDTAQTETTPYQILLIEPAPGAPLRDVEVIIDLHKAVTGFGAVETAITIQLCVARKVDGTNWRREAYVEAALSGTNAANRSQKLVVGNVGVTEDVAIFAVFSADVTSDMELPYIINYCGLAAPTVTAVAA